jgi:hypothetical protein
LTPTYRSDAAACAKIAQAASWASPNVEVIIRDNSGDPKKRALIAQFKRDNCKIVSVDPCAGPENFAAALKMATGEFIFYVADDDIGFDRAVAALPGLIDIVGTNPDVVGMSGTYAIETSKGSALVSYKGLDSDAVETRVASYLNYSHYNVLVYTPMRRALYERVFAFMRSMPFFFSFHDQVMCLLFLLNGKFVTIPNLLYAYDVGPWEDPVSAQKLDARHYTESGLDPAISKLHWFLCAFEGAILIRSGDVVPDHAPAKRQAMADQWFSLMFQRFLSNPRLAFGSQFVTQADALCDRLRASQGRLSFIDMLSDICRFIALFSDEKAQGYLSFWAELLRPRKAAVNA